MLKQPKARPCAAPERSAFWAAHGTARPACLCKSAHGLSLAYLVAFAVYGLLLLAVLSIRVADRADVAENSPPAVLANEREQRPGLVMVGRISWANHCHCLIDQATATKDARAIPLGRSICLMRGEMEITYTSGASVLLRSPCVYRVISANGGFLLRGNLTALVANGAGADGKLEKGTIVPAPESLIELAEASKPINPPCFFIRTPRTILISQGGEFTAGVDDDGNGRGLALWGPLKAATSGLTGERLERFVGVLEAPAAFLRAGPGASLALSIWTTRIYPIRLPVSGAGKAGSPLVVRSRTHRKEMNR